MLLIYTSKITNRLNYVFNLIFNELIGVDYSLTTNIDEFVSYEKEKLNYSERQFNDEIFIAANQILFERGIKEQTLNFIDFDESKAFFPTHRKESILPFDPFAASFYLLSRYEEYLPYLKDIYGRFDAKESIAYQQGFLQKPVVNLWAKKITEILKQKYPDFKTAERKYTFIPTIDIDAAYSYRLKGFIRTIGGYFKSIGKFDFKEIVERTKVLFGSMEDPFDNYQYQFDIQKKYNLKTIYFILFADYGVNDKNIPTQSRKFQSLIKTLGDYADVGIHPSYTSNFVSGKLPKEVKNLSLVLNKEITKSRQHFLILHLPVTYQNLVNLDITDDYSMGYASEIGFRAGICDSFYFYDLESELVTKLRIHPFAVMDGTLKDYMNVDAKDAMNYIKPLIDDVKAVDGTFISLWHNESLSNKKRWQGWKKLYEEMIEYALEKS